MWIICVVVLVAGLLPGLAAAEGEMTVIGTGQVAIVPDMATISLIVSREDRQAQPAVDAMSEAARRVLVELAEAGIAAADLQSSSLRLMPIREEYDGSGRTPKITGYRAETEIRFRIRELARLGEVLDSAVGDGANGFESLSFSLQEPHSAEDEARRRAVAEARRKAALYAEAAGVELGELRALSEATNFTGPVMMDARMMAESGAVAPGEVTVEATVTLVYAIGD